MRNKKGILVLAVVLVMAAPALADGISGQSKFGNGYATFSEGLTEQQEMKGSAARCNFLLDSVNENGAKTDSIIRASLSEFTEGDKGSRLGASKGSQVGALQSAGMEPNSHHQVRLVDFDGDHGAFSEKDRGEGPRKYSGGDGEGNATGTDSGAFSPAILAAEPGLQTLLLFGLAGLGMLVYRRKTLTNAI